ncbi:hypothetical protein GCM10027059_46730 [Myceligenerans halotolerans]
MLAEDPFVSGDIYPGDLLLAVVSVPDDAWNRLSDAILASRLATVISGLPDRVLANLPKRSRWPRSINQQSTE